MGELEAAVAQHLLPLEQLGAPARILRAFRRLLFLPPDAPAPAVSAAAGPSGATPPQAAGEAGGDEGGAAAAAAAATEGGAAAASPAASAALPASAVPALLRDLPRSVLLHYLFSQGPAAVASPHARAGLTPVQYSLWLDEHSQVSRRGRAGRLL